MAAPVGLQQRHDRHADQPLYLAGQIGWDPTTGRVAEGMAAQVEQALRNIVAVLAEADADTTRHRAADLVRHRHGAVPREGQGHRPKLSPRHGQAFPGHVGDRRQLAWWNATHWSRSRQPRCCRQVTAMAEPQRSTTSPATTCRRASNGRTCCWKAALPGTTQLRHRIAGSAHRSRQRRAVLPAIAGRDLDLRRTAGAGEPHRQCADAAAWHDPRQPRAAARAEHADDGRGLSGGDQGRRHRGRDHAAAARARTRRDHRQGAHQPCACAITGCWPIWQQHSATACASSRWAGRSG